MRQKRCAAYFTVEAVMILPFVIWIIGLVIYLMLFQYNRCLMEQDLGMVLLRACSFTVPAQEQAMYATALCEGVNQEKYLACDTAPISVNVQVSGLTVSGALEVNCPLGNPGIVEDTLQAERRYQYTRQSPIFIVRTCNKIKQALENKE